MNRKFVLFAFSILCISNQSFAYNEKKCQAFIQEGSGGFDVLSGGMTSTSQFVSSWGDCSSQKLRDGMNERRELYFTFHREIAIDAAKGEGENIGALARLSGCKDESSIDRFITNAKTHYADILAENIDREVGLKTMDRIKDDDPFLRETCKRGDML